MFVGILVTTERPLIGAFLPSSLIVRLVSEILCKGIRDFLSGISEQGTGNSSQGSETTRVEVHRLPRLAAGIRRIGFVVPRSQRQDLGHPAAANRGWMSEKILPPAGQVKCFYLTSPFIEHATRLGVVVTRL